ncbi:hypothetical protein SARC_16755, partial [Sphaeroforma arctica JP610]
MVRKKLRAHYNGPPLDTLTNQKAKTQRVDCESSGVSRVQSKHSDIPLGGVWKEPLSHLVGSDLRTCILVCAVSVSAGGGSDG